MEAVLQIQATDGSFEVTAPARPILQVVAAAPGVEPEAVLLIVGDPGTSHELEFELGHPEYLEAPEQVVVRYWPDGVGNGGASQPMTRDTSGVWTAVLPPLEMETLYRLQGATVSNRSLTGGAIMDIERPYVAWPSGILFSVAPASEDSVRFRYVHRFRDQVESQVSFGAESRDSEIWRDAEAQFRAFEEAFYDDGPEGVSEWQEYANSYTWREAQTVRDSLLQATRGLAREAIALSYLALTSDQREATTTLVMEVVSPESPAWNWTLRWAPSNLISGAGDAPATHAYLRQVFANMSNDSLAATMMHTAALNVDYSARENGQIDAAAESLATELYYDLVRAYPEASATKQAAKTLDPQRMMQNGNPVPAFELASMDEPDRMISNESLLGTTYLVDFWGSWCAPCIREMPYMHAAYEKYRDRGFTILSFAWDHEEGVDAFRKEWPMPWEHILLEGYGTNSNNPVLRAFNVTGYPDVLLVGADGIILEVDDVHLREAALDSTLAVHLES